MLEGVDSLECYYDRSVTELKWLHGQLSMAGAIDTGVTRIAVLVLFLWGAGAVVRYGFLAMTVLIACLGHVAVYRVDPCMHAVGRYGQQDHEEYPGA